MSVSVLIKTIIIRHSSQTTIRSASSTSLDVRRTRLSIVGDRAFPVTAAPLWNNLPSHGTAVPLSTSSAVDLNRISSYFLIPLFWLFSHLYSDRSVTRHFGHDNGYHIKQFTFNNMMEMLLLQSGVVRSCGWAVAGANMSANLPQYCHHLITCSSNCTPCYETETNCIPISQTISLVFYYTNTWHMLKKRVHAWRNVATRGTGVATPKFVLCPSEIKQIQY